MLGLRLRAQVFDAFLSARPPRRSAAKPAPRPLPHTAPRYAPALSHSRQRRGFHPANALGFNPTGSPSPSPPSRQFHLSGSRPQTALRHHGHGALWGTRVLSPRPSARKAGRQRSPHGRGRARGDPAPGSPPPPASALGGGQASNVPPGCPTSASRLAGRTSFVTGAAQAALRGCRARGGGGGR